MRKSFALSVATLLLPGLLLAQFKVSGTVADAKSGEKLVGANIIVEGTHSGTSTDVDGNYSLTVPAGLSSAKVTARYIGYKQATVKVTASGTQDFSLKEDFLRMDAVLVTGVAGALTKTKTPFAIDKIDSDVLELVPATSVEALIRGKSAGVKVVKASGQPGETASVQLRGATSINAQGRSQAPLYIVDGIIIDPSISGSPMSDINPDDVASIEIIKGAAGSSDYGARAANGVIAITTKRGSEIGLGQTRFRYKVEMGSNQLDGSIGTNGSHYFKTNSTGDFIDDEGNVIDPRDNTKNRIPVNYSDSSWANGYYFANKPYKYSATGEVGDPLELLPDNGGRPGYDHVKRFYSNGNWAKHNFSMSRNDEKVNVYAGLSHHIKDGVFGDYLKGLERSTFRLNTDLKLPYNIKLGFSSLISKKEIHFPDNPEGGGGGPFFDLTFFPWDVDIIKKDKNGEYYTQPDPTNEEEANPVYQITTAEYSEKTTRTLLGTTLNWSITPRLKVNGSLSYDLSNRQIELYLPKGFKTVVPQPTINEGHLEKVTRDEPTINGFLGLAYATQLGDLDLIAKGRYTYENYRFNRQGGTAWNLAVSDVPQLGTGEDKSVSSTNRAINSDGFSFGAQGDFKDRYILDVTFRQDRSSLFGPGERVNNYYRVSGAYRLSEEAFWAPLKDLLNEFKFRLSRGTAGVRPAFSHQYETWSVAGGNPSKQTLGNRDLKPQLTTETEYGIDFTIWDRVSVEYTKANTLNEDQLLRIPLAGYYGYSAQWRNAGTLEVESTELSVNAALINTRNMSFSMGLNWDKYDQTITGFDMPGYLYSAGGPKIFYMKNNVQYGSFWGDKWMTDTSQLPEADRQYAGEFQVNDDGYLVYVGSGNTWRDGKSKTLWGRNSSDLSKDADGNPLMSKTYNWGRPIKYADETGNMTHQIGTSIPDFSYAINFNFRFKGFHFYALFDGQNGGNIYNRTRQWGAREAATADVDQFGKSVETEKPTIYYRDLYNVNAPNSFYVENASLTKLRELSVTYDLSSLVDLKSVGLSALRIGIIGRNLITWTNYTGYDPEVGKAGGELGSAVNARVDSYDYPNYQTFSATLELDF
ncbi:SusC/RagA family TonB-linked outer membrane protein [Caldithrix abyssi]|nr:SusC/RagA family TonB-linked outer membrane protein [Caldithrix abyssi]